MLATSAVPITRPTPTSSEPETATRVDASHTMLADAARHGAITTAAADTWLDQRADAGRRGRFFWAVTMFAITSRHHQPRHHHEE